MDPSYLKKKKLNKTFLKFLATKLINKTTLEETACLSNYQT